MLICKNLSVICFIVGLLILSSTKNIYLMIIGLTPGLICYITIMIQSEVADRLCAKAGSSDYGAITAVLAYYGLAEKLFTVSAGNFMPAPKVNSTVVRIKLHKNKPYVPADEKTLFRTIKGAFEQRRKTLPNALSASFSELDKDEITQAIVDCGHKPDIRGEKLSIEQFVALSDKLYEIIKSKNN